MIKQIHVGDKKITVHFFLPRVKSCHPVCRATQQQQQQQFFGIFDPGVFSVSPYVFTNHDFPSSSFFSSCSSSSYSSCSPIVFAAERFPKPPSLFPKKLSFIALRSGLPGVKKLKQPTHPKENAQLRKY